MNENIAYDSGLPDALYHATPVWKTKSILKEGLTPPEEPTFQEIPLGGTHTNRVFLSRFDRPTEMYLPSLRLNDPVTILEVNTDALEPSNCYPDDALYNAYFQDQVRDYASLFPDRYKQYQNEAPEEMTFGTWLLKSGNEPNQREMDEAWAGRPELTLYTETNVQDLGEMGYQGSIPPKALSVHKPVVCETQQAEGLKTVYGIIQSIQDDSDVQPMDGDCFEIAMDLLNTLEEADVPGDPKLVGVFNGRPGTAALPMHALVQYDGRLIDGTGIHESEGAVKETWEQRAREENEIKEANLPEYRAPEPNIQLRYVEPEILREQLSHRGARETENESPEGMKP